MRHHRSLAVGISGLAWLALVALGSPAPVLSAAAPEAKITSSGDGVALAYTSEDGVASVATIPLHTSGDVKYFSAGTGLEERAARYPPFPLKLIFVAGPRAYLSRVAVSIADSKGTVKLEVPADHVTGPWLFVDLPAGAYTVTASREGQPPVKGQVTVAKKGGVKTLYLRWKENTP